MSAQTPAPYGEPPRLTADAATWRAEDALRDKIAAALFAQAYPRSVGGWDAPAEGDRSAWLHKADAVLPIVAAEVTAAREQGVTEERARIVAVLGSHETRDQLAYLIGEMTPVLPTAAAILIAVELRDLIDSRGGTTSGQERADDA